MKVMGNNEKSVRVYVPIYASFFEVVISRDIGKSVTKPFRIKYLGEQDIDGEYCALHCYRGACFSIFFQYKDLCHNTISHEIFHATMRMAERCEVIFTKDNHEPFAYLQGYLTEVAYGLMKKHKIKIK